MAKPMEWGAVLLENVVMAPTFEFEALPNVLERRGLVPVGDPYGQTQRVKRQAGAGEAFMIPASK